MCLPRADHCVPGNALRPLIHLLNPWYPCDAGRLHFAKFESARVEDAIAFIEEKGLHRNRGKNGQKEVRVIATGMQPGRHAEMPLSRCQISWSMRPAYRCLL